MSFNVEIVYKSILYNNIIKIKTENDELPMYVPVF